MSQGISQTLAELYLNYIAGSNITIPSTSGTVYLGLSSTVPLPDGTNFTELTGAGYARQALTLETTTFLTPSSRLLQSASPVFFPTATADWLQHSHWGIFSAASGGTLLMWGGVQKPRIIKLNSAFYFPAGNINIRMVKADGTNCKGDEYANAQLNTLRGVSLPPISNVFLALGTKTPVYQAGAVDIGELTTTGYHRIAVAADSSNWEVTAPRTLTNKQELRFIDSASLPDIVSQFKTDQPTIKSWAIYSGQSATDPLYYGSFGIDAVCFKDDIFRVGIGAISIME